MNMIRPTIITDAMLHSSTVPETDHSEYAAGTTYAEGDYCIVAADHTIYQSLQSANTGNTPSTSPTWWLNCGKTNRWKAFDDKVASQASQTTSLSWTIAPGMADSIDIQNIEATDLSIVMADQNTNLITNGTAWTGATGTTQPTGWDLVGTPSAFLVDSGALKITADAASEGTSQTVAVTAGTSMQLLGKYRNTSGDVAQYAVYDVTHSADIVATTDLPSSTVESTLSSVFTVPAGCTSIKISIMAKTVGDIVWFDSISLSEVVYSYTKDLLDTTAVVDFYTYCYEEIIFRQSFVTTSLPPYSNATITITLSYTGGTAKCGEIVLGRKLYIGRLKYGVTVGINDYSHKEVDQWGNATLVEGDYSDKMTCALLVENSRRAFIKKKLAEHRATPAVYVGSEADTDSDLHLYGYFVSFEIMVPQYLYSEMSLEVNSLT